MSSSLVSTLGALFATLVQARRLVQLRVGGRAPMALRSLVPYQAEGSEGVCTGLRYRLQCLGDDANLPLKLLQGRPIGLAFGDDRGGERLVCGIVTRSRHLVSDGAASLFELQIDDALQVLRGRHTWRVYRDASVIDITEEILRGHLRDNAVIASAFEFRIDALRRRYPARAFTLQAGENDAAFLERLWRREGIAWHFVHELQDGEPRHVLVLADDRCAYLDNPAGTVRFHRADATESRDSVVAWQGWRAQGPSMVDRAHFDYKCFGTPPCGQPTILEQGEAGDALSVTLTDYHYDSPWFAAGAQHHEHLSRARVLAHEFAAKGFEGESVVRQFSAGSVFALAGHPEIERHPAEDRRFTLTRLKVYARNGIRLAPGLAPTLFEGWSLRRPMTDDVDDSPVYRNRFECVREATPVVPWFDPASMPRPGLLSAIVVTDGGLEVDVDAQGRIAVRFPFARPHEHAGGAGASGTPRDSARIRVMHPWADNGYGAAFWPRVGSEVMVGFIQGDPDKPVVLGAMYDGTHEPPRFSAKGSLPANSALYGFRSKEIKGDKHSHMRFDDSTGQVNVQTFTDHRATQLNQGWLGTPRDEGISKPRGEGFELATDASGALRSAKGMLISAWQRLNATGNQLSREEALRLMEQSVQLFKQLGQYATQHQGNATDTKLHVQLQDDLKHWDNGSNLAPGASPGGGAPVVAITAPAGVYLNTPMNAVTHAGVNVDTVALQHLQLASGERTVINAGKSISLFAQSEGIKVIAHHEKLLLQSQSDDTIVNAAKNLKLTASDGKLHGMAADEILLAVSGGAYIKLAGSNVEIGCPGSFTVKAASHVWAGAGTQAVDLPRFSAGDTARTPVFVRPTDGKPVPDAPYEIEKSDGSIVRGVTDADGKAAEVVSDQFEHLTVRFAGPEA